MDMSELSRVQFGSGYTAVTAYRLHHVTRGYTFSHLGSWIGDGGGGARARSLMSPNVSTWTTATVRLSAYESGGRRFESFRARQ